jgi:hypothetical protein
MVEEAYRSTPASSAQIVDHDHPDILRVGMAVDHYGVPFSGIGLTGGPGTTDAVRSSCRTP